MSHVPAGTPYRQSRAKAYGSIIPLSPEKRFPPVISPRPVVQQVMNPSAVLSTFCDLIKDNASRSSEIKELKKKIEELTAEIKRLHDTISRKNEQLVVQQHGAESDEEI
jgi:hypothetical protein